ncbi:hypothetical protein E2562_017118 [Oryza meyeriana var. granulata]|uniref:Retroviral polymerase SH3-like domain-containing protein n=1 Tax=Oryza meyeriana var. granulata TaxID=110450 RepID=A0A6G1DWI9_9ORYZ|nr:hypothetical protein E2562_017118 [Oryza meyeriana var. granulata]
MVRPNLRKLDDRGTRMVFIGYEQGSKAYRMYDSVVRRVCVSRDVVFNETTFWDWSSAGDGQGDNDPADYMEFSVENFTVLAYGGAAPNLAMAGEEASPPSTMDTLESASPEEVSESFAPTSGLAPGVEFVTPPSNASAGIDEAPRRYRTVANTLATTTPILYFDYGDECMLAMEEPTSFTEAEKQSC